MIELKYLKITGEVITTPYTFAATTNSIWWNKLTPVFVDIEMDTYNISSESIESAITDSTSLIMVVHSLGNPANMNKIMQVFLKLNH